jgi:hypothetical protein
MKHAFGVFELLADGMLSASSEDVLRAFSALATTVPRIWASLPRKEIKLIEENP